MNKYLKTAISFVFVSNILFINNITNNNYTLGTPLPITIDQYVDDNIKNINLSDWKNYNSEEYFISLKYPSNWKLNNSYSNRFDGNDGFFQLSASSGSDLSIDQVVNFSIKHKYKPYGSNPHIKNFKIQGQDARLIFPSPDQPKEIYGQVELIVKYPKPVVKDNETYYYLILWADAEHIEEISKTLKFLY